MTKTIEQMLEHYGEMERDCWHLFVEIYLKEGIAVLEEFNKLKDKIIRTHEYEKRLLRRLEKEG